MEKIFWKQPKSPYENGLYEQGYNCEVSFLNGKQVPYGTKDSIRVEYFEKGRFFKLQPPTIIEITKSEVTYFNDRTKLIDTVTKQATYRNVHLPKNTTQKVIIDTRQQSNASIQLLSNLINRIARQSQGILNQTDITALR